MSDTSNKEYYDIINSFAEVLCLVHFTKSVDNPKDFAESRLRSSQ